MINFPDNPVNEQLYTYDNTVYVYKDPPGIWLISNSITFNNNNTVIISSGKPNNPKEGTLWYDNINNVLLLYVDNSWAQVSTATGPSVYVSEAAPANPKAGMLWYSSLNNVLFIYLDNTWVQSSNILTGNSSEANITVSASPPLNPTAGMLWYDDVNTILFIYLDGFWVQLSNILTASGGSGNDHGALTGLTDDDHTQYSLADGTRWTTTQTANRVVISNGSGNLVPSTITTFEVSYLSGVTSAIQTQLDSITSTNIVAGEGLSGGGDISASRTLDLDISNLTTDGSPDGSSDYVVTYDASASNHKKVLLNNLPGGGGGGGTINSASNVNTAGVGVYKTLTGDNLEFKGINAASNKLTVVNTVGTNTIDIDIDESNLSLSLIGGTSDGITEGSTNLFLTGSERTKLSNTEISSQLDSRDTNNRMRSNHTGTQLLSTISDAGTLAGLNTVDTTELANNAVTLVKIDNTILSGSEPLLITGNISTTNSIVKVNATNDIISTGVTIDSNNALAGYTASINLQTNTTYTLLTSDTGKVLVFNNASDITVDVPTGLGIGFNCTIIQKGAGQVILNPIGTTINSRLSHDRTAGQFATIGLVSDIADNYFLTGDSA